MISTLVINFEWKRGSAQRRVTTVKIENLEEVPKGFVDWSNSLRTIHYI